MRNLISLSLISLLHFSSTDFALSHTWMGFDILSCIFSRFSIWYFLGWPQGVKFVISSVQGASDNVYYCHIVNAYSVLDPLIPVIAQWDWYYLYFINEEIGTILNNGLRHAVSKQEASSLFDSKACALNFCDFIIDRFIYNLIFF